MTRKDTYGKHDRHEGDRKDTGDPGEVEIRRRIEDCATTISFGDSTAAFRNDRTETEYEVGSNRDPRTAGDRKRAKEGCREDLVGRKLVQKSTACDSTAENATTVRFKESPARSV